MPSPRSRDLGTQHFLDTQPAMDEENTLKAIVRSRYGSPDVLRLKDVARPVPKDDEVLIGVHAASVNAADVDHLRGKLLIRIGAPLRPKYKTLGSDVAGQVEAVGKNVMRFQPGDEVFGDTFGHGFGAFAEYVCAPEDALARKPTGMTFEQVATLPQAAVIALQGLRDIRQVDPGQHVLINGAGGGMGTFAVQIAKAFGAEVTGVDSARKLDLVRSIGADHVIDYAQEDFTQRGQRYDLILDMVGNHSISDCRHALSPTGTFVLVGGPVTRFLQVQLLGARDSRTEGQKLAILMWKSNQEEDVAQLQGLFEAGKVTPVIDRSYSLSETPVALRRLEQGHVLGKIVITV